MAGLLKKLLGKEEETLDDRKKSGDTEDALEVLKESIVERREASRSITKSAVQLRRLLEKGARNGSKPEPAGEGA